MKTKIAIIRAWRDSAVQHAALRRKDAEAADNAIARRILEEQAYTADEVAAAYTAVLELLEKPE